MTNSIGSVESFHHDFEGDFSIAFETIACDEFIDVLYTIINVCSGRDNSDFKPERICPFRCSDRPFLGSTKYQQHDIADF